MRLKPKHRLPGFQTGVSARPDNEMVRPDESLLPQHSEGCHRAERILGKQDLRQRRGYQRRGRNNSKNSLTGVLQIFC